VRRLDLEEGIFAISGGVGTPNFIAALPYINQAELPAVGMYAPSNQIGYLDVETDGTLDNPHVYMPWADFVDEFQVLTEYLVTDQGAENVAIMLLTGDVGDDALKGTEQALAAHGQELVAVVNSEATTTDYSSIALELKNSGAEWVLMIQTPTGMGRAIEAMHRIDYFPKLAGHSDNADTAFVEPYGDEAEGMFVATKVRPTTVEDPLIQEFVDTYEAKFGPLPPVGEPTWQAVGWVAAALTAEALENAPALTRDCFEWALQQMENVESGFIPPVTFGPEDRQGARAVGVAQLQDGKVAEVAEFRDLEKE
jgi:branched-chain amino acid transport system substrate-binding protein